MGGLSVTGPRQRINNRYFQMSRTGKPGYAARKGAVLEVSGGPPQARAGIKKRRSPGRIWDPALGERTPLSWGWSSRSWRRWARRSCAWSRPAPRSGPTPCGGGPSPGRGSDPDVRSPAPPPRRGPDWLIPASRLSCSSLGPGLSLDRPNSWAAATYLRTVIRDNPVPGAISLRPSPACQRRITSPISTLVTSTYAITAPQTSSAVMVADTAPRVGHRPRKSRSIDRGNSSIY